MKTIPVLLILTFSCSLPGENFLDQEYPNPVVYIPDYVVSAEYKNNEITIELLPQQFFNDIKNAIVPYYHSEISRADAALLYSLISEQIIIKDIVLRRGGQPPNQPKDPSTRMCLKRLDGNRFKILYYYRSFRREVYYVEKLVVFNNNHMAISDLQSWKVNYEYP